MEVTSAETEFVLWLDRESRVMSFHEVAGYERNEFARHDDMITYALELAELRYRIQ